MYPIIMTFRISISFSTKYYWISVEFLLWQKLFRNVIVYYETCGNFWNSPFLLVFCPVHAKLRTCISSCTEFIHRILFPSSVLCRIPHIFSSHTPCSVSCLEGRNFPLNASHLCSAWLHTLKVTFRVNQWETRKTLPQTLCPQSPFPVFWPERFSPGFWCLCHMQSSSQWSGTGSWGTW